MIDNVVMLITGALKQRDVEELLPRCHPLGDFDQMAAVGIARTPTELYSAVLVDTPLGRLLKIQHSKPFLSKSTKSRRYKKYQNVQYYIQATDQTDDVVS